MFYKNLKLYLFPKKSICTMIRFFKTVHSKIVHHKNFVVKYVYTCINAGLYWTRVPGKSCVHYLRVNTDKTSSFPVLGTHDNVTMVQQLSRGPALLFCQGLSDICYSLLNYCRVRGLTSGRFIQNAFFTSITHLKNKLAHTACTVRKICWIFTILFIGKYFSDIRRLSKNWVSIYQPP